jgi:DNA-binding SARP family transcriptional activator
VDFRILGPVEVQGADAPIDLRRAKQRALLAALLLRPNEVVSVDALIECLWGPDRPPLPASSSRRTSPSFGARWERRGES